MERWTAGRLGYDKCKTDQDYLTTTIVEMITIFNDAGQGWRNMASHE